MTELRRALPITSTFWQDLFRIQSPGSVELARNPDSFDYASVHSLKTPHSNHLSLPPSSSRPPFSAISKHSNLVFVPNDDEIKVDGQHFEMSPVIERQTSVETLKQTPQASESGDVMSDFLADTTLNDLISPPPLDEGPTCDRSIPTPYVQQRAKFLLDQKRNQATNPLVSTSAITMTESNLHQTLSHNTDKVKKKKGKRRMSAIFDRENGPLSLFAPSKPRPRSLSLAIPSFTKKDQSTTTPTRGNVSEDIPLRLSSEWKFSNYAFTLDPNEAKEIKRPDILDVIHFCHYANMAYVKLDNDIQKKTDILLYFSPLNDMYQSPYMISIDHDWTTIVIAIRGTYSAADLLVDLRLDTAILDSDLPDGGKKYRVHAGFMKTAKNIVKDIVKQGILEKAAKGKVKEYNVVVCGHSLGAVCFLVNCVIYLV